MSDLPTDTIGRAVALLRRGDLDAAEPLFSGLLAGNRDFTPAILALGEIARRRGDLPRAIDLLRRVVKLSPHNGDAWTALGEAQRAAGRNTDAARSYEEAIRLKPDDYQLPVHLALVLLDEGRFSDCIAMVRRSYAMNAGDPVVVNNLMSLLNRCGDPDDALAFAREFANKLDVPPMITPATKAQNLGVALCATGDYPEGTRQLQLARDLAPDNAAIGYALALAHLATGDHTSGFALWGERLRAPELGFSRFLEGLGPMWDGHADLAGKTLYLRVEQGVGDAVQFARYLPLLTARGARIVVGCDTLTAPLLSTLPGVAHAGPDTPPPPHDYAALFLDLPLLLGLADNPLDPASVPYPYLSPDPTRVERFRAKLKLKDGRKNVGVCWSGNPRQPVNDRRAIQDPSLLKRLALPGVRLVSAQKVVPPKLPAPKGLLFDITADLADFADTAAFLASLDLLITTDTSVAHLAGALGLPAWVLLHTPAPHWPYGPSGPTTPWYPSVRLYRQPTRKAWPALMEQVRTDLELWLARE